MPLEFPYQIVTFLGKEPSLKEPVYNGAHGWFPQIALKRRFKLNGVSEEEFIEKLKRYFTDRGATSILTGELVKPERMPVQVVEVVNQAELKLFHNELITYLEPNITSRFPERDGENYYPHITAEYYERFVIPVEEYTNKEFSLNNIWLLKDLTDEDSVAYAKIL